MLERVGQGLGLPQDKRFACCRRERLGEVGVALDTLAPDRSPTLDQPTDAVHGLTPAPRARPR